MKNKSENKKILLISVPFSGKSAIAGPKMEHQGLCYLRAYLKNHGYEVDMIDGNAMEAPWYEAINKIDINEYFLTGFSVYSTNYENTKKHIKIFRKSGFKGHITMGGHYPTFCYKTILEKNPFLDSIILGEGEESLLELVKILENSGDWRKVPGLAYRKEENVVFNSPPPLINPLTFTFLPDRSSYGDILKKQNFATISSSRGCWGNCAFCSVRSFYNLGKGPCWRPRTIKEILDELEYLNKEMSITCFSICDDNFIGTGQKGMQRAREIAAEIMKRSLDIAYSIDCRPDGVDEELFSFLYKSGMVKVNIGVESFVERQQKLYGKKLSDKAIDRAILILKKLDVLITVYTIFFDPFVTFQELSLNLKKAMEMGPENFPEFATFLQLFPGIPLYEILKKKKLLHTHKVLQTEENEYWINYKFQNPGIEELFVMFLTFEVTVDKLLAPFTGISSSMAGEKYYRLYKSVRTITCQCFLEAIEKMQTITVKEEYGEFTVSHMEIWKEKIRKIINQNNLLKP